MAASALETEPTTDERPPFDWRVLVACVAIGLLGFGLGLVVTRDTTPGPGSVDAQFLQDMRWHHEQAIGMSMILLEKPAAEGTPALRQVAREIVQSQAFEGGRMAEMLREMGAPVANESGTAMGWMGMPVPVGQMPGMASSAAVDELEEARGRGADEVYIRLMIAHHLGGLHMAEDALRRASSAKVQAFAAGIVDGQTKEIAELRAIAATL